LLNWGFYNNNLKHNDFDLAEFRYSFIKVYGNPPITYPGLIELEIFLNGLSNVLSGPLPVYRFRSMVDNLLASQDEQYKILYCYAFSLKNIIGHPTGSSIPVIFFMPVRNNDEGNILERIQDKFKASGRNFPIEYTKVDVDYNNLLTFLIDKTPHLVSFSPVDRHMM
jgi:hypothetical protein